MRPVRPRFEAQTLERLEERLAMAADAVYDFYASDPSQTLAQYQYDPFAMTAGLAHQLTGVAAVKNDYGFSGSRQTVAVIDTGIAWDHHALGRGYGANHRVVGGWDFAENDANPYDDGPAGFHGTHVSGIIGSTDAKNSGVATGVDLVGLRVFNDQGTGKFEWVEQALRWVHENRNRFENPITTVNLSLGAKWNAATLPNWATLEDELKLLYDDGIFVSVAAGNDFAKYNTPGLSYPAVSPYVVAVGSVTSSGVFSNFSQRAERILAAPGQSITSTLPDWFTGGNGVPNDFGAASGTSMAAPYVAGAAVLVREAMQFAGYTSITQDTIYNHLRSTADVFYDTATSANYFRINVGRAIDTLMPVDEAGSTQATGYQLGSLGSSTSFTGAITKKSDVDAFSFTATVNGTITLHVNTTDQLSADVRILGADAQVAGGKLTFHVTAGQQYGVQLATTGGLGKYRVDAGFVADPIAPPPTPTPREAWGAIDLKAVNDLAISGQAIFQFSAIRTGLLTIEALASAGSNIKVELLNASEQLLATANRSGDALRLDANVVANGNYLVRITGSAADLDLRLANLVSQTGTSVSIFGTAGDDVYSFSAGAQHVVTINGMSYRFHASQATAFSFSGQGGNDAVTLTGTTRGEAATFHPSVASLVGANFRATATGATSVTFVGGGGSDSLNLADTSGDDLVTIARGEASLATGTMRVRGLHFTSVTAISSSGNDEARLYDTPGNDRFTAYATSATLTGVGYLHTVRGFDRVIAQASSRGDTAYMYDSSGNDTFTASPTEASLAGLGFHNAAIGFGRVFATASEGHDTAVFYDSLGNDQFYGRANISWMTSSSFYNSAAGFDHVTAHATAGHDLAYLYDSSGSGIFLAGPSRSSLQGSGFRNAAESFDRVFAYSTSGRDETRIERASQLRANETFFHQLGSTPATTSTSESATTRAKLTELLVGFEFATTTTASRDSKAEASAIDFLLATDRNWQD